MNVLKWTIYLLIRNYHSSFISFIWNVYTTCALNSLACTDLSRMEPGCWKRLKRRYSRECWRSRGLRKKQVRLVLYSRVLWDMNVCLTHRVVDFILILYIAMEPECWKRLKCGYSREYAEDLADWEKSCYE